MSTCEKWSARYSEGLAQTCRAPTRRRSFTYRPVFWVGYWYVGQHQKTLGIRDNTRNSIRYPSNRCVSLYSSSSSDERARASDLKTLAAARTFSCYSRYRGVLVTSSPSRKTQYTRTQDGHALQTRSLEPESVNTQYTMTQHRDTLLSRVHAFLFTRTTCQRRRTFTRRHCCARPFTTVTVTPP